MKKRVVHFLIFFFLFMVSFHSHATHYMGGEITWECLSNGNYRFILKLYRECNGMTYGSTEQLDVTNHPTVTAITMTLVSQTDISPVCNPDPSFSHINCYPAPATANTGAVEEWYYTSDAVYPNGVTLAGIPPAQGWIFSHSSCCRNTSQNLTNGPSLFWFLRAIMYSYKGQDASPCFDNSPTFAEKPSTVICTGYPFTYNHNAWDKDLDSLTYEWAPPLESANTPISSYVPGYSYTSPLPGPSLNPNNVPATINPHTGEISFTSYTQGAFITVTKVTALKCGIKVAEIFREMQIVLLPCGNNLPPVLTAPFPNSSGNYVNFSDTVYAGTLVTFNMTATDTGLLPNGSPQTIHMYATGSEFGTNYTSTTTGCLNPPCATLKPAPQPAPVGISGQNSVQTTFRWQTDCSHLNTNTTCGSLFNVYNFVIKAQDDFCPAPAISVATVTIVVLPKPILPPPELRCVAINASGNVTLSWATVHDTANTFNSYDIYSSSNSAGPFSLVDSISDVNQFSYTDLNANANNQSKYNYIKTKSACGNLYYYSASSDTLKTILLNVLNTGLGTAALSWNPIHNPNLPTSSGFYNVYREFPPGTWTMIGNTKSCNYLDSIPSCSAYINYYVAIDDSLPCTSTSNINGALIQDVTAPNTPVVDSVSVNQLSGKSVIGWTASSAGDVKGYIIYENKNGIWVPIDTVFGASNTYYTNNNPTWANPDSSSLSYCVAVFDSCRNTSPISPNQKTIFLTSSFDICKSIVTLNWTAYVNMHPALNGYKIYVRKNNGPLTLLGTNTSSNLTFVQSSLTQNSVYIYCIQAFDTSGAVTSTSNTDTVHANSISEPQFVYLRYATVINSNYVELKAIVDTSGYISKCKFMRADNNSGPFKLVGTASPSPLTNIVKYNDHTAYVNLKSYYYDVIIIDSCGNEAATSNIGRTIYLQGDAVSNMKNDLTWNEYEDWLGSVSAYNIYRKVDDILDPNPIATLAPVTISYTDDVSSLTSSNGKFSYIVEAKEGPGNPYLCADSSTSNEVIIYQPPRFYVPNAFVPKGVNKIFIPVNVYVNTGEYLFTIYNRWGLQIFQTRDTNTGWDGTIQGEPANQGVYVYSINYKDAQGKVVEKYGTVTLLR